MRWSDCADAHFLLSCNRIMLWHDQLHVNDSRFVNSIKRAHNFHFMNTIKCTVVSSAFA